MRRKQPGGYWLGKWLVDVATPRPERSRYCPPGHADAWLCTPDPFAAMWAMVDDVSPAGGKHAGMVTTGLPLAVMLVDQHVDDAGTGSCPCR